MTTNNTLPTITTLYNWYNEFNNIYFSGKLPNNIIIEYSNRVRAVGDWLHNKRRLRITNQFILTERQYKEILLHEMIHTYQTCVLKIRGSHNCTFKNKMYDINYRGNWNIQTKFPYKVDCLRKEDTEKEWIALIFDDKGRKCIVKTSDKYLNREFNKFKQYFKDIKVYRCKGGIFNAMSKSNVNSYKFYPFSEYNFKNRVEPYLVKEIKMQYV